MQICLNYNSVEIDRNKLTLTKKGKNPYFLQNNRGSTTLFQRRNS